MQDNLRNKSTIIDRLLKFIELKNMSKREFYSKVGLSNGFLDKNTNIGSDKIEKIIYAFPELNIEWLVLEKEPILLTYPFTYPFEDKKDTKNAFADVGFWMKIKRFQRIF